MDLSRDDVSRDRDNPSQGLQKVSRSAGRHLLLVRPFFFLLFFDERFFGGEGGGGEESTETFFFKKKKIKKFGRFSCLIEEFEVLD